MLRRWTLRSAWSDVDALTSTLSEAGLSPREARRKAEIFRTAAQVVLQGDPPIGLYVPGRVEVLGKHTDYAGGESIVAAIERGFCMVASPRSDRRVFLTSVDSAETIAVDISPDVVPALGHWANYPMTVVRRLARNFPDLRQGAEIVFGSDLPPAAGMSSSSAFIVGVAILLAQINSLSQSTPWRENIKTLEDLAGYLATVENGQSFGTLAGDRGVGTQGGSEDHTAILLARPGELLRYVYVPVAFVESIPLLPGWTFVIASSGVVAEKTGSALELYNAASRRASQLTELWRKITGGKETTLGAIVRRGPEAVAQLREIIARHVDEPEERQALERRLAHFLEENQAILPEAAEALRLGDFERLGRLVERSQRAAETLLGNQVPETSYLAAAARELGAAAASAFGAGFGGAVWALVRKDQAADFALRWAEAYRSRFPERADKAQFFVSRPGPATFVLEAPASSG